MIWFGLKVGEIPLVSLFCDYFLILYQMVGFSGLDFFLGGLLSRSILYIKYNATPIIPINIYNNSSTLLYKYLQGKKIHRLGG